MTDPHTSSLLRQIPPFLRPPKRLPLSTWSESNVQLSSEYSARSGPLRLYGWQRAIFDTFTDPYCRETVLMCGVQLVKTLFIQCATAYIVKEDPGPILMTVHDEEAGKDFSKERLVPMIRDNPCLRGLLSDSVHDGANTILGKTFPGGRLSIVSARVPGNMARRTIRYLFCDEVDKYPPSAGKEGDPMDLAEQRLMKFGSRAKIIRTCSPTIAGESRIDTAYRASDMRRPWVLCPKCSHPQLLRFGQVKFDTSLDKDKIPLSAYYLCSHPTCGYRWTDIERKAAADRAVWKAERPFHGIAGFWISHLYSPDKNVADIVRHFLRVKDDKEQLKVFTNTVLAELWEEKGETPDAEILYSRREDYPHGSEAIVPQRGLFLTAAVDVQDNPPRLECEVKAWGRGRENWSIAHHVIQSFADNGEALPVTSPELWSRLDADILQRDFLHESGHSMAIRVMCIDTGSRPDPVYKFARQHAQISFAAEGAKVHAYRTVVPIKGNDDPLKIISAVSKENAARKRQNVRIVVVGTHCAKQQIYDSLRGIRPDPNGKPRPGCFHHPMYERGYFDQLCSEYRIIQPGGKIVYQLRPGMRNEGLDLCVYNLAAATICGIDRMPEEYWRRLEASLAPMPVEDLTEEEQEYASVAAGVGTLAEKMDKVLRVIVKPTPAVPPARPPAPVRRVRGTFI